MSEPTKTCNRCKDPKLLSEFGVNKFFLKHGAKDGRSIYCRSCCNANMTQHRARLKTIKEERAKAHRPDRKPMIVAPRLTPQEKVLDAIAKGYCKFEDIEEFTNLHEDLIADTLAILAFDEQRVRVIRSTREFHLNKAA